MTDTTELLEKIATLRQRLDQAQGLAKDAAAALVDKPADPVQVLEHKVRVGAWHNSLIDGALRPLTCGDGAASLPVRLSARAQRLLKRGRDLLGELRALADEPS